MPLTATQLTKLKADAALTLSNAKKVGNSTVVANAQAVVNDLAALVADPASTPTPTPAPIPVPLAWTPPGPQSPLVIGAPFSLTLATPTGGTVPYSVSVSGLPPGLSRIGYVISGIPTAGGLFSTTATIADASVPVQIKTATIAFTVAAAPIPAPTPTPSPTPAPSGVTPVLLIIMENESASAIEGNAQCPYINSVVQGFPVATKTYGQGHPSLPNYLALVFGQTFGVTDDRLPDGSAGATPHVGTLATKAGLGWSGYFGSLPSDPTKDGTVPDNVGDWLYQAHHNPFVYNTTFDASKIKDEGALLPDLSSPTPPAFAFLAPNMLNDQHDGPLSTGDTYLKNLIPQIQATAWYKNGGTIIVTYDEGAASDTSGVNGANGGNVLTIIVSAAQTAAPDYAAPVNSEGLYGSICRALGLTPLAGGAIAANGNIDPLLLKASAPSPTPSPAPAPSPSPAPNPSPTPAPGGTFASKLGIYAGNGADPSSQAQALGISRFPYVMSFVPGANLSTIADGAAGLAQWATGIGARLIAPFNMLPDSGVTGAQAAAGAMHSTAVAFAQALVANGQSHAIIRIAWEMNGDWFPWGTSHMTQAQFLATWADIVAAMRSVPGQAFLFYWNPTLDLSKDLIGYLPPAGQVDVIGLDVYDQTAGSWPGESAAWQQYLNAPCGLNWIAQTAAARGLQIGFGEWGLGYNAGANGGDDAAFVTNFAAWCQANPVLFACVWCDPQGFQLPGPSSPQATAALKAACA